MIAKNFVWKSCAQALVSLFVMSAAVASDIGSTRIMTFPTDQSFGVLTNLGPNWNSEEKHPKGTFFADARGSIRYSTGDQLMLTARYPLTENPSVLNKLPVDAIKFIRIASLPAEDKIFGPLTRLTGLCRVDLEEGEFHDKNFGQLSKLVNLEALSVKECFVTGESLTHFTTLKKLRYLSLRKVALDWKLLNKSGATFPALRNLHLTDTNLTDEGLRWLEKVPNLTKLSLDSDGQVTDKGLPVLNKLVRLRKLELRQMKVSADGVLQLKKGNLRYILLEDSHYTPAEERKLRAGMPEVHFEFSKHKIPEGTMEIFAPLH